MINFWDIVAELQYSSWNWGALETWDNGTTAEVLHHSNNRHQRHQPQRLLGWRRGVQVPHRVKQSHLQPYSHQNNSQFLKWKIILIIIDYELEVKWTVKDLHICPSLHPTSVGNCFESFCTVNLSLQWWWLGQFCVWRTSSSPTVHSIQGTHCYVITC